MTADRGSVYLLDANVLIALAVRDHVHHDASQRWLAGVDRFAVCPITQGALVRFLVREGESATVAQAVVAALHRVPGYEFWADDLPYDAVDLAGVYGHRQVTDSYLAGLAEARREGCLATLDRALAARRPATCHLVVDD